MNIAPLKEVGLTNGEIKVYLALLEIGSSSIGPILDKSGITKSMIYRILEKLTRKGLVSYIIKEKTKHYQASSPSKLLEYIDNKEEQLQKNKEKIEELIPQLLLQQQTARKSTATMYEGFKGLMTAYENRYLKLQEGDEVLLYGLPAEQPGFHHAYWKKHHQKLATLKIRCRMLYNQAISSEILDDRNKYSYCSAKRMPFDIETASWVIIYKDTTVIAIPQGNSPFAFEITSQEVADSFKNYFEAMWKLAK